MQQAEERDPVCGMKVDPSKAAASVDHQGLTVYFCSQGCAAKYRVSPEKYAPAKPLEASPHPARKTRAARRIHLSDASRGQANGGRGVVRIVEWRSNLVRSPPKSRIPSWLI
jgi:YHS domain-containing protein